jgi:hypothetical protein
MVSVDKIFKYYWDWLKYNSPKDPHKVQQKKSKELSPVFIKLWQEQIKLRTNQIPL